MVSKQLETPQKILASAIAVGEEVSDVLEPVVVELMDCLLLKDPIDRKGAINMLFHLNERLSDILHDDEHDMRKLLEEVDIWFEERSNDERTPVSGDVRSSFEKAHKGFLKQSRDLDKIFSSVNYVLQNLQTLPPDDDPETIHSAKALALVFYGMIGERTGNQALENVESDIANFYRNWESSLKP